MSKFRIAVPWNLTNYYTCNGFHPLYRPLFDKETLGDDVSISILDEPSLISKISTNRSYIKRIRKHIRIFDNHMKKKWISHAISSDFIEFNSIENMWLSSNIPGDIEFHHTSPLTSSSRPYILHIESFLPMLMPFSFQGGGNITNTRQVMSFYRDILEEDNCIGVFSHLLQTLDNVSDYFKSNIIDRKLHVTPIGLSEHSFDYINKNRERKYGIGTLTFLFTSSAHQNPNNLIYRGIYSAILFAQNMLANNLNAKFIFRCKIPSANDIADMGIDYNLINRFTIENKIIWIDSYISDNEQLKLFLDSDFFLLPSVNLHSVSIMQAQLCGCIPIVTDTIGTSFFVEDLVSGVVIDGVKECIWHEDIDSGVIVDDHRLVNKSFVKKLSDSLMSKVSHLFDCPDKIMNISTSCINHATNNYAGEMVRHCMGHHIDIYRSSNMKSGKMRHFNPSVIIKNIKQSTIPIIGRSEFNRLFEMPPVPLMIDESDQYMLFSLNGMYACVDRLIMNDYWNNPLKMSISNCDLLNHAYYTKDIKIAMDYFHKKSNLNKD